jgi:hypothetical protein
MQRGVSLFLLAMLFCATAFGQAGNSTVRGSVRDQADAVVPTATVTLTNVNTNVSRTSQTNEAGIYAFPGVIPGSYRLVGEFAGMQRFEGTLTVQTGQDASVDIVLRVAQAATTVDVKDVTPLLNTDSPALTQTLERQRIEQLPIQGRGYQNLLQTVPGLVYSNHGHQNGGRPLAYGLQVGSTQLTMDGNPLTEEHEGWDVARLPDLDAIQELHVEVNNSSAKYARPTTIVMSSRSGTNQFHGAVFYNNRNSGYGVARRREDFYEKPPYVNRNEYGLAVGGPVSIPKIYSGRNRTFWFFSWEGTRSLINTTTQLTVPTEAMKQGDFRGLVDAQGRQFNLYDPATTNPTTWQRQPLSYRGVPNVIDPARISPVAKFLFDITKPPTHPQVNPLVGPNFIGVASRPLEQDTYSIRIDHRISERDLIYGRIGYNTHFESLGSDHARFEPVFNDKPIGRYSRWWPNHQLSTTWMHTFSPTTTNEMVVTGTRDYKIGGSGYNAGYPVDFAAELGLPNPFGARNWPAIQNFNFGVTGEYSAALNFAPFFQVVNYLTFQDNVTKIVKKHELSFGYQYRLYDMPRANPSTSGPFTADTQATSLYDSASTPQNPIAQPFTGHNLANLYLGVLNYQTTFRRPTSFLRRHEHAFYIQDNWKVAPRLTLQLGMRHEVRTPLQDRNGLMLSFDTDRRAYVLGADLNTFIERQAMLPSIVSAFQNFGGKLIDYREAGLSKGFINMNWKQFGPRAGFAYRAFEGSKEFVLRGGFRVSYYPETTAAVYNALSNPQIVSGNFVNSVTSTPLSPDGLPNYGLRSAPQYIAGVNTPNSVINTNDTRLITRGSFSARILDPNMVDPMVYDWNLTFEKEIMANTVIRLGYLGNRTANLSQMVELNRSTPDYIWYVTQGRPLPTGEFASVATRPYDQQVYGNIDLVRSGGFSWYNGLQMGIERRFANGFGYQMFYDMANALEATQALSDVNQFLPGAVPTDLDERTRFLNYRREGDPAFSGTAVGAPKHRVRWNFIADLPFGRGKKFGGSARGFLDKIIGGWQIAGTGLLVSRYWTLPSTQNATNSFYPNGNSIEIYGYKYPVEDCTSGVCYPGYLWWNGYIPTNRINSRDANGKPNGIMGVPDNYKPAAQPLIPWGSTQLPANAPANTNLQQFWDTNNVWLPLNNGTVQRVTFNDGLHPWRNQFFPAPLQWFQDAAVFKFVKLSEQVTLRFNVDFFNVFNHPNNPTAVAGTGILDTRTSGSPGRLTQLALRLTW